MNYTTKLHLNKPEKAEQYNLDHWNDNSDTIDAYATQETTERQEADALLQQGVNQAKQFSNMQGTAAISQGGTGETTAQAALESLCASVPTLQSSTDTDLMLFKQGNNVKNVALSNMADKIYDLIKNNIITDNLYSYFLMPLISSNAINAAKTVVFPSTYNPSVNSDHAKLIFKVVFQNGQNTTGPYGYMTLNNIPIVSYQNGQLNYIPIHEMTENNSTVYKVVSPNTCLELYYNSDWDGNGNPAWVVVGNPLVLSSSTYSFYADGLTVDLGLTKSYTREQVALSQIVAVSYGEISSGWTAPEDGFMVIGGNSDSSSSVAGVYITGIGGGTYIVNCGNTSYTDTSFPFNKGDIIRNNGHLATTNFNCWVRYYNRRDYAGR